MDEIPHEIGQKIMILIAELRSLDNFKEKWTNFKVTLIDTGKFNIEFAYIPEEDHWPSLSMRGISDLSEEELDRDYPQIPKELWEERVKLKEQNK
ncbi:antitoxin YezG family protein [Acinetobacter sp. I-MWF]|uniref:antitoxin YezG family protein n=1 Tax=Acinetobacter sp. I-MWF TaxID=2940517 RepID=UPI0021C6BCF7|nr:antitoxin YezG family protein [Acinetobacter sp. I-MWF]MCT9979465.1 antitoxin YezG family protein [Acinetobacter sp. I-MWF]